MNSLGFDRPSSLRRVTLRQFGRRISVAVAFGILTTGCEKPVPPVPPLPVVQVMEIRNSTIPLGVTLIGQLDSPQNVEVRARVEAFVEEIAFTEGGKVKKGDLLFKLDERPYIEKLVVANASLAEATVAKTKYGNDVKRLAPLVSTGGVSQQDLDNAVASLEASKAMEESAKASVQSAKLDLGYCEVRAPIDGLIGAKEVSVGNLVGKGEPTLLAIMSSLDPMWFYCNISEAEYVKAKTRAQELNKDLGRMPLTLILPGAKEHDHQGKLVFFDRAVNIRTGTLRMRAEFPNPTEILRPGMFARARIDAGTREGIMIPERAILELQGQSFVWVVDGENKVHRRPVKLGDSLASEVAVLGGLEVGERIILEGIQKVRDGTRVTILDPMPPDAVTGAPAEAGAGAEAEAKPAQP